RVVIDALGAITETNEGNNALMQKLTVVSGTGVLAVDPVPLKLSLSGVYPNPSSGGAALTLELPHEGAVEFSVYDVQGRQVWSTRRTYAAGRWRLHWSGGGAGGARVRSGLYLARVTAAGRTFVR